MGEEQSNSHSEYLKELIDMFLPEDMRYDLSYEIKKVKDAKDVICDSLYDEEKDNFIAYLLNDNPLTLLSTITKGGYKDVNADRMLGIQEDIDENYHRLGLESRVEQDFDQSIFELNYKNILGNMIGNSIRSSGDAFILIVRCHENTPHKVVFYSKNS